ncbi:P-loop containing nucleoside triphosphate hydrolase protein [Lasiosphaeria miniovina]|uniref:Kinesin-like protein n=1 Tax=Lasiosphaeria miniovina TaxID=1954250 RepID=A0AA40DFX9_9PEZI|nr:P-loop containing nucleoside triphosphate hydrolase protein [Lasiosphaeria miniovina]KAK0701600.1 P-loop containing nucleoside triphosphate hydrolase protein [Lasiosphaeria miniovina]
MERESSMSASQKHHNLFQVYLRLRPAQGGPATPGERFLEVEDAEPHHAAPKHITLNPPNDRRRAIEKFAFTQVFEEDATQLDVFHCTGVVKLVEGVLAPHGGEGTDALLATLGVTGSGKTHTILGSRSQRGLTQLALDVIFRSLGHNILDYSSHPSLEQSITASDPSEATIFPAATFLDTVFADSAPPLRASSRAPTPMIVRPSHIYSQFHVCSDDEHGYPPEPDSSPSYFSALEEMPPVQTGSPKSVRVVRREDSAMPPSPSASRVNGGWQCHWDRDDGAPKGYGAALVGGYPEAQKLRGAMAKGQKSQAKHFMSATTSARQKAITKTSSHLQGESFGPTQTPSRRLHRPSAFPQQPDVSALSVSCDPSAEYAVVISMYEVYNDRIFDLLTPPIKSAATKEYRRRPLLFKSTETSSDRKVVAGLRKVVCGSLHQALMVLEAGLHERRVAGTGSNSVSSRSHGFFSVEVKKRARGNPKHSFEAAWGGSTLTVVDLAGSERARDAKTAGATLAEAGKINESLMYLGQCLQMQSDAASKDKPNLVPFRQCKLTELLFSNCFPSMSSYSSARHRNPQKAVMIVTADPNGDFNATSQILRYSALAREVTVPRIPSITQTILTTAVPTSTSALAQQQCSSPVGSPTLHHRPFFPPGSTAGPYGQPLSSPNIDRTFSPLSNAGSDVHRATMEVAALEIARLSEELDYMRQALETERSGREEAESHLLSMEDRMVELEQAIREDCTAEFERRFDIEMARWRANMQVEMERGEEHWGRKIEVFERSMAVTVRASTGDENMLDGEEGEDDAGGEDKENVLMEDVNQENDRLRRDNEILRRELAAMSPTKRLPLQERSSDGVRGSLASVRDRGKVGVDTGSPRPTRANNNVKDDGSLRQRLENLRVGGDDQGPPRNSSGSTSPKKAARKLAGKRWDGTLDDDLF